MLNLKYIYLFMLIAALLTIAKTWKQPVSTGKNGWRNGDGCIYVCVFIYVYVCVFTHTMDYYSTLKMMDETWSHHIKWNKSNGKRQIMYHLTYMHNLRIKDQSILTEKEIRLVVTRGGWWWKWTPDRDGQKVQTSIYKLNKY